MPRQSKYSDKQVEKLLNEVTDIFKRNNVTVDLALMVLGNSVTHLLQTSVGREQQTKLADTFCHILKQSLKSHE